MVKVTAIRDDDHKRILRCSEGRRVLGKDKIKEILDTLL